MDSANNKISQTSQASLSGGKGVASNTNCPKMGSRRIFTPQFKLQVLESYRNDHDCKGNQRATARKYNIHRRQIQKWLQCEASLRSSVANINQNAVKHQFHNVSMQQQATKNITTSQAAVNGLSCPSGHLQSTHSCLDSTKGSTMHKSTDLPSLSSNISISSAQETRDILDANFAAVVAASAGTVTSASDISSVSMVSPLRPSAVISTTKNTNTSMSPLLHHHHHYGIQTFSNISSSSNVPILVHHLNSSQPTSYQYPNIHYTPPTLPHHQTEKDHATYLTPLVLPITASNNNYTTSANDERFDKFDLLLMGTRPYPKILAEKSFLYNNNQFHSNSDCPDTNRFVNSSNALESFNINQFNGDSTFSSAFPFGPMDLSLRQNKDTKSEIVGNVISSFQITENPIKKVGSNNAVDVVDLTYRKRRISNSNNENPEKHQKVSNNEELPNKLVTTNASDIFASHVTASSSNCNEEDDIEIEVGTEEKFPPTSKPVKLFKPYLLGEYENNEDNHLSTNKNKSSKSELGEETERDVEKEEAATNENTFPEAVKENINICVDNSNFFVESRSASPRSVCSPATYISTLSPTNLQYCKGSPASSGYESSTSAYSDTSISSRNDTYTYRQTYSLNLQMQSVYHDNINVIHPSKHVQRWLEKDDSNSMETNPSIALFV